MINEAPETKFNKCDDELLGYNAYAGKSGDVFDKVDSGVKKEEQKNMITSGHGYCSAYIPTGTVKSAGAFNLSNYLGTHKKLYPHKHDHNLQIGLNANF